MSTMETGHSSAPCFNASSGVPDDSREILTAIGHPATATLAILSLLLNSLVIVVILHQRRIQSQVTSSFSATPLSSFSQRLRKLQQQQSQQPSSQQRRNPKGKAQIHLLCLAISDLSLGLVKLGAGIWLWTLSDIGDGTGSSSTSSPIQRAVARYDGESG